jgi:Arc/MetJ family transcription regulator
MTTKKAQNDRIRIDDELRATKMRLEKIEQKNDALV